MLVTGVKEIRGLCTKGPLLAETPIWASVSSNFPTVNSRASFAQAAQVPRMMQVMPANWTLARVRV